MKSLKSISLKLWKRKIRKSSRRETEPEECAENRIPVNDPLSILREDTFSNEEIDEQTGRMIREAYKRQQNQ